MTYEQWWWQFIAEHEEWRYADSDAIRKAAFEAGKESLRQQLVEKDQTILDHVEIQQALRQQLAAALAAIKVKDEVLRTWVRTYPECAGKDDYEALAIQPDDAALKAWLGEPVGYDVTTMDGKKMLMRSFCNIVGHKSEPLYRAWEPTKLA